MDQERSSLSQIFSLLMCVALFAAVGAALWGFGYWFYYDPIRDGHRWDWDAMETDTKIALIGRLKFGGLGGGVAGVVAFFLSFFGKK